MTDRQSALRNLSVGDIFHAQSRSGVSLVCLVTALDGGTISARRIHTQDDLQFDRNTGFEVGKPQTGIDCVAPLPQEIYDVLLAMDQRYQAAYTLIRKGIDVDPRDARYTPDERRAHDFLHEHIASNPI